MDLDAFTAARRERWERLDELGRSRRLTGAESDELVRLYQAVATDLSQVRAAAPDPSTVTYLSQLLARTRVAISGAHEPSWRDVSRFVMVSLPAAFYRIRWWTVAVMVAFLVVSILTGWYVATNEQVLDDFMDPVQQEEYVNEAFASYYDPGVGFAAMVWTNNAWIAAQCVGLGISGVWPVFIQAQNAVNVGAVGGMMADHGALDVFLSLIAPHGMLELTAIWIAGAAGLKIFWTVLVPGPRTRVRALREEGTRLVVVALGLVFPPALVGAMAAVGLALPWSVPVVASLVLAGVLFVVAEVDLRRRAEAARHQLRLATCAYTELVALERAGDAGVVEALERAATISTSDAFTRIHDALVRAELAGHPPWQGLADLATRTGVAELADVADIMATSGRDGAAVYTTLRARAAALRTHLLTSAAAKANATSEHLIVPVAGLGIAFMALVGYPAFARIVGVG